MSILRLSTLTVGLVIAVFALSYNPSFADSKNGACAPEHCVQHGDDGGGDKAKFSVTISGSVDGNSVPLWTRTSKQAIGYSGVHVDGGVFTNLDFFHDDNVLLGGANCFDTMSLRFAGIRQRKGDAEASFWVEGFTKQGSIVVLYILSMTGTFNAAGDWLPSVNNSKLMTMTDWDVTVGNGQSDLKPLSCDGNGNFPAADPVIITVTRIS